MLADGNALGESKKTNYDVGGRIESCWSEVLE